MWLAAKDHLKINEGEVKINEGEVKEIKYASVTERHRYLS